MSMETYHCLMLEKGVNHNWFTPRKEKVMPQGKGTYGSVVGRPPKKPNKYQGGGAIEDVKEVLEAAQMGQELESIPLESIEPELPIEGFNQEFPIADARDRNETYQLGGMVKNPTAPSITPSPQYKKGGKVK